MRSTIHPYITSTCQHLNIPYCCMYKLKQTPPDMDSKPYNKLQVYIRKIKNKVFKIHYNILFRMKHFTLCQEFLSSHWTPDFGYHQIQFQLIVTLLFIYKNTDSK